MIEDHPKKLCLLIFSPMLALLLFGGMIMAQKWRSLQEMTYLQESSGFVVTIVSSLVHETQKERGLSAGFLGSRGTLFDAELKQQRRVLDQRVGDIDHYLASHPGSLVADCVGGLGRLSALRARIDRLEIPAKEVITQYSDMVGTCIDSMYPIAQSLSDKFVSQDLYALINILKGKDRLGIERALLSLIFAEGRISNDNLSWLADLLAGQKIYFDAFVKLLHDRATADRYRAAQTDPIIEQVAQIERRLGAPAANLTEIKATDWFQLMTAKIDRIKNIEDAHSDHLIDEAAQLKTQAKQSLMIYGALILLAFWITLLSMRRGRRLCLIARESRLN